LRSFDKGLEVCPVDVEKRPALEKAKKRGRNKGV
jgi:hypothetical protein